MKKFLSLILVFCFLMSLPMTVHADEPVVLTCFIDHTWMPVDSFEGIIPEEITRQTGVKLDVTFAVDATQLGVMAASGELPDLVYTQNWIDRFSTSDLCYSIEDLIAQYNVDWDITPKQLGIGRGLSMDGKAYTILNHVSTKEDWVGKSSVPMVGTINYRHDIWEELGSPEITDLDSFYALLEAAHEAHPELITFIMDQYWNIGVFRCLTGMSQVDFLEQEDGSYIHYAEDPRWEAIIKFINKCYRAGFMSTDDAYFVPGSQALSAEMYFSSTGSTQNGVSGLNVTLHKIDPNADFYEMVPWPTADYTVSDFGWSGLFITKSCKDPEAAIKLMAWMFSDVGQHVTQMGREGIDYEYNAEGQPIFSEDWVACMNDGTHDKKYNPYFYFGGSETVESDARCATLDPAWVAEAYAIMREKYDNKPWVQAALPVGDMDEKVIWDEYRELLDTYEHKIIMAATEEDADALIAEFRTNADRVGLKQLDAYMTEKIAELMPMYQ